MKKSITLISTIALATVIGTSAGADTINGIKVASVNGHKITLENGQVAEIDGDKVYIDGQEVILSPDIEPVKIPTQQDPKPNTPTQTTTQGVPSVQQQTPSPVVTNPSQPQTPTKTPSTPVIPADPKTPATPVKPVPSKTPSTPTVPSRLVENVPVKTYPQSSSQESTQTIESHTTTVEKGNSYGQAPTISSTTASNTPTTTVPSTTITQAAPNVTDVNKQTVQSNTKPSVSAPKADIKRVSSIKVKPSTVTYHLPTKKDITKSNVPTLATMNTLPTTGEVDGANVIIGIVGALSISLGGVLLYTTRKSSKRD